jgi:hypothetical protein
MVKKDLTPKFSNQSTNFSVYSQDENNSIHTTGVDVDDGNYDNGSFLDRDYDLRDKKNISINLENIGANAVKYKILSTNKHFANLDSEITDDDFDKEEKVETVLNPRSKATGSVELTGGPSVAASGTITCLGVLAGDTVTVNGLVYTAVAGAKANNTQFSIDTSNNAAAADLANSITNDTRTGTLNDVTATSSTNVVTCQQTVNGTGGNATTLASSTGVRLAVSGATFSGGVSSSMNGITVDGVQIMSGAVSYITSLPDTAAAIASLITISATVNEPSTAAIVSSTTTLTKTDVNMSGGAGGKADTLEIVKTSPSITAIRLRAKESVGGSPGKIRADIKAQ